MIGEWIVPAMAVFLIFGGGGVLKGILDSMNRTRIELAQLKAQQQGSGGQEVALLRQELAALREEVHSLRDTSTQYDLSFDTALQRMEQRVAHVEQQQRQQIQA